MPTSRPRRVRRPVVTSRGGRALTVLLAFTLPLGAALLGSARASGDWSATFTGSIAEGATTNWQAVKVELPEGRLALTLTWDGPADLNLFVKDPSGSGIARATSQDQMREVLSADIPRAGTYTLAVKARTGSASYSLAAAVQATAAPPPPDGSTAGTSMSVWAPVHEAPPASVTEAEALDVARANDLVTAGPRTYAQWVGKMREVNPDLRILVYLNGMFAQESQGSAYPEAWYARDKSGTKIRSLNFGNYLMRPDSSGWVADRASTCQDLVRLSGYDGCLLDMLGTAPLGASYGTGLPVNPATSSVWTQSDWLNATGALAQQVRAGTGVVVMGNGLGNGPRYFAGDGPSSTILRGIDGGIAESWLRTARASVTSYPTVQKWQQGVDMLADAGDRERSVAVMVKLWADGSASAKDAWHQYALASFLLGAQAGSTFTASYALDHDAAASHAWWRTSLGAPLGPYSAQGSVYVRTYESGLVVVNPGSSPSQVRLPGTYTTLDGQQVEVLDLPPTSGRVLVAR